MRPLKSSSSDGHFVRPNLGAYASFARGGARRTRAGADYYDDDYAGKWAVRISKRRTEGMVGHVGEVEGKLA